MTILSGKFKISFLVLCSWLVFGSCTHYYYGPNSNNIPALTAKNDFRISALASSADETSGFELQSSYAFTNHFGGMFNFYSASGNERTERSSSQTITEKGNGTFTEFGLGYFSPLADKSWIFETYAGFGGGTVNNDYGLSEKSKVAFSKIFLQPSISYALPGRMFEAGLALKMSNVNFKVKEDGLSQNNNPDEQAQLQDIRSNPSIVFLEPSIMLRGGLPNVKLQFQYTGSSALSSKMFRTQNSNISLGVIFTLEQAVKK